MRIMSSGKIFSLVAVAFAASWFAQIAWSANTITAAVSAGDLAQSRELIKSGVDVNLADPDGTTPLLWAVYNSSLELVQLLLDAGADPNVANSLDISPLLQASRNGDAGMISALLAKGANLGGIEFGVESSSR